jgi:hypothetical protein
MFSDSAIALSLSMCPRVGYTPPRQGLPVAKLGSSASLTGDVSVHSASPLPSLLPSRAIVRCIHLRAPSDVIGTPWSDGT